MGPDGWSMSTRKPNCRIVQAACRPLPLLRPRPAAQQVLKTCSRGAPLNQEIDKRPRVHVVFVCLVVAAVPRIGDAAGGPSSVGRRPYLQDLPRAWKLRILTEAEWYLSLHHGRSRFRAKKTEVGDGTHLVTEDHTPRLSQLFVCRSLLRGEFIFANKRDGEVRIRLRGTLLDDVNSEFE